MQLVCGNWSPISDMLRLLCYMVLISGKLTQCPANFMEGNDYNLCRGHNWGVDFICLIMSITTHFTLCYSLLFFLFCVLSQICFCCIVSVMDGAGWWSHIEKSIELKVSEECPRINLHISSIKSIQETNLLGRMFCDVFFRNNHCLRAEGKIWSTDIFGNTT